MGAEGLLLVGATLGADGLFLVVIPIESFISDMVVAVSRMEVGVGLLSSISIALFSEAHWSLVSLSSVGIWCKLDHRKCV